jgi:hypothetical protein
VCRYPGEITKKWAEAIPGFYKYEVLLDLEAKVLRSVSKSFEQRTPAPISEHGWMFAQIPDLLHLE